MAGSGYSRQSVASIVPTAVVRAAPINAEYDKLRDAFTQSDTGTTGHRHDGSSDEGSYVPFIADLDKTPNAVKAKTAGEEGGEGYVLAHPGGDIKLVNRAGFTAANRAVER